MITPILFIEDCIFNVFKAETKLIQKEDNTWETKSFNDAHTFRIEGDPKNLITDAIDRYSRRLCEYNFIGSLYVSSYDISDDGFVIHHINKNKDSIDAIFHYSADDKRIIIEFLNIIFKKADNPIITTSNFL